jgi:hypothetical protein
MATGLRRGLAFGWVNKLFLRYSCKGKKKSRKNGRVSSLRLACTQGSIANCKSENRIIGQSAPQSLIAHQKIARTNRVSLIAHRKIGQSNRASLIAHRKIGQSNRVSLIAHQKIARTNRVSLIKKSVESIVHRVSLIKKSLEPIAYRSSKNRSNQSFIAYRSSKNRSNQSLTGQPRWLSISAAHAPASAGQSVWKPSFAAAAVFFGPSSTKSVSSALMCSFSSMRRNRAASGFIRCCS